MHSCTHALLHLYTHTHSCTHTLMHSCTYALLHSCAHILIHSYTPILVRVPTSCSLGRHPHRNCPHCDQLHWGSLLRSTNLTTCTSCGQGLYSESQSQLAAPILLAPASTTGDVGKNFVCPSPTCDSVVHGRRARTAISNSNTPLITCGECSTRINCSPRAQVLTYAPLPHAHKIHSAHALLPCAPPMHSSHALLSCTPLISSTPALSPFRSSSLLGVLRQERQKQLQRQQRQAQGRQQQQQQLQQRKRAWDGKEQAQQKRQQAQQKQQKQKSLQAQQQQQQKQQKQQQQQQKQQQLQKQQNQQQPPREIDADDDAFETANNELYGRRHVASRSSSSSSSSRRSRSGGGGHWPPLAATGARQWKCYSSACGRWNGENVAKCAACGRTPQLRSTGPGGGSS